MKQVSLLFTCFILLVIPGFAQNNESTTKHYCDTAQIELTETMILVHCSEGVYEIDSLLVDQGGLYFTDNTMRCPYCRRPLNPKNTCECPSIHHSNS